MISTLLHPQNPEPGCRLGKKFGPHTIAGRGRSSRDRRRACSHRENGRPCLSAEKWPAQGPMGALPARVNSCVRQPLGAWRRALRVPPAQKGSHAAHRFEQGRILNERDVRTGLLAFCDQQIRQRGLTRPVALRAAAGIGNLRRNNRVYLDGLLIGPFEQLT